MTPKWFGRRIRPLLMQARTKDIQRPCMTFPLTPPSSGGPPQKKRLRSIAWHRYVVLHGICNMYCIVCYCILSVMLPDFFLVPVPPKKITENPRERDVTLCHIASLDGILTPRIRYSCCSVTEKRM